MFPGLSTNTLYIFYLNKDTFLTIWYHIFSWSIFEFFLKWQVSFENIGYKRKITSITQSKITKLENLFVVFYHE